MSEKAEDVQCEKIRVSDAAVAAFAQPERPRWSTASTYADVIRGQDKRERPEGSRHTVGDSIPSGFGPLSGPINPALLPFAVEFIGYPALAMLRQNILVQNIATMFSEEMTKKWVKISPGDDDVTEEDVKRVRELDKKWKGERFFRECAEECIYSGGCLAYIDVEDTNLEAPMNLDSASIPTGTLKGFKILDPAIVHAEGWQSSDPLKDNYYLPEFWRVRGKSVHKSRFLYFAETSVPEMLKPAYNFFGISMPQMLLDYIYNFERTRDAMIRAMRNHSLLGLETDMSQILQGGEARGLLNRLRIMQATRDQDGIAAINMGSEKFFQITTPLSGFMELGSMQLELLALASRGPVTKLFGTPPRGFNASGDNYQADFASVIHGRQKRILHENVVKFHKIIQLNEYGRFIENLEYEWPDTREMTDKEKAEINKLKAETDSALVTAGIALPEEVVVALVNDPERGYQGVIDLEERDDEEEAEEGTEENGSPESYHPEWGPSKSLRKEAEGSRVGDDSGGERKPESYPRSDYGFGGEVI